MNPIRWGILATGWIANKFAEALTDLEDAEIVAVGSRSQENADRFGEKWGIRRRYGSYEALAADAELDIIYIATPHTYHYDNMKLCLNAGKHVLCEKAFAINAAQAEECIDLARAKNRFLMEAMWTKFIPATQQILRWIAAGRIGDVRLIQAHLSFDLPYSESSRVYQPHLGGGALLDLGVYPASLVYMILGQPDQLLSHAHLHQTGVDELNSAIWIYQNGAHAVINSSQRLTRPAEAIITGTDGYIKMHDMFIRCDTVTHKFGDGEEKTVKIPFKSNGLIHQAIEAQACLRAGKTESAILPLSDSLAVMRLMDQMRAEWGVVYPEERGG